MRSNQSGGLWRWAQRFIIAAIFSIVLLAISGAVYQAIASARDSRNFPPPGKLIDIGGLRLHINVQGKGGPTVVLEAGLSGCSINWALIQPEVAKFSTVCSYDRAGTGWSDPAQSPRDSRHIAEELHALLIKAGLPAPYILVGSSLGGTHARVFAQDYPADVAGIVLVDAAHEDQAAAMPKSRNRRWHFQKIVVRIGAHLSRFGLIRLFVVKPDHRLPAGLQNTQIALVSRSEALSGLYAEMVSIKACESQVRGAIIPQVPLLVLAAGYEGKEGELKLSKQEFEIFKSESLRLQSDLARLSTNSLLVTVLKSGHVILLDQPNTVVEGIRTVVNAVNGKRSLKEQDQMIPSGSRVEH